jgi:hypothetical protein
MRYRVRIIKNVKLRRLIRKPSPSILKCSGISLKRYTVVMGPTSSLSRAGSLKLTQIKRVVQTSHFASLIARASRSLGISILIRLNSTHSRGDSFRSFFVFVCDSRGRGEECASSFTRRTAREIVRRRHSSFVLRTIRSLKDSESFAALMSESLTLNDSCTNGPSLVYFTHFNRWPDDFTRHGREFL